MWMSIALSFISEPIGLLLCLINWSKICKPIVHAMAVSQEVM